MISDHLHVGIAEEPELRERIFRFRYAIYVEEMQKHLPCADPVAKRIFESLDGTGSVIYAQTEDEIVGTLRLNWDLAEIEAVGLAEPYELSRFLSVAPRQISFTSRMMVAKRFRGSKVAIALISFAYKLAVSRGVELNFIHTAARLVPFFKRLGYQTYAKEFRDGEVGPRTPLVLFLNDFEHFVKCQSPLAAIWSARQLSDTSMYSPSKPPDCVAFK